MSDKTIQNKAYQSKYVSGYRRDSTKSTKVEHMHNHNEHMYVPYTPVTYYTGVISILALFLIFILFLGYINHRPIGYITKYNDNCLLKLTSTYSAIECL